MFSDQPNCTGVVAPKVLAFSTAAISAGFSLITTPGNLLVCLAVLINPNRNLRTSFNFFIVNLALADLTVGAITEPLSFVYHIREGLRLQFSLLQMVHHYLYFITCTASILSLGALTAERHSAATSARSYRARQVNSNKRYQWATCGIWVISAAVSGFYFIIGPLVQSLVVTVTAVVLTFVILAFTYLRIYGVLKERTQANLSRGIPNPNEDSNDATRKKRNAALRAIEYEKKLTKVLASILVCYICCFIPACVLIFTMNLCSSCSCEVIHWMRDVQFWFILLNSAVNPYLYAWRIPHFKRAIVNILKCQGRIGGISPSDLSVSQRDGSTNNYDQSVTRRDRSTNQYNVHV
ncbi:alpha-1B adrenergic receptor-like isoform X2 [Actinia tenebrosa]|uniref:Alpha-1B adrenergic receptor-like isoform X2 n=1 Tax=Actinia tenebrosa TaxID=6105 RepID=A0A6P8IGU0_ACTTE|nr:alpha-1B adrenergic receptor-like isoform X2 [Actinia tenebrosa]